MSSLTPRVMGECVLRDVSCDRGRCRITDVILMWSRPQVNVRVMSALASLWPDFCDEDLYVTMWPNVSMSFLLIRLLWWKCLSVTMWNSFRSHFLYIRFAAGHQGRSSLFAVIWSAGVGHMFHIWSMFRVVLSTKLVLVPLMSRRRWGAQPSLGHGPKGVILTKLFDIVFLVNIVIGFSTLPLSKEMQSTYTLMRVSVVV